MRKRCDKKYIYIKKKNMKNSKKLNKTKLLNGTHIRYISSLVSYLSAVLQTFPAERLLNSSPLSQVLLIITIWNVNKHYVLFDRHMSPRGLKENKLGIYYWLQKNLYTVWKWLLWNQRDRSVFNKTLNMKHFESDMYIFRYNGGSCY